MKQEEFINRLQASFQTNKKDATLLSDEVRFFRGELLFNYLNQISKTLNFFDFQDQIIFEKNLPFIVIDQIKLLLNQKYFLKHSSKKFISSSNETINFLNNFKIMPKHIIDLGACWGEYSLSLSKQFPKSKIYSIEGSEKNFETLNINLKHNPVFSNNIKPFNLIISDHDGFEEMVDSVNTMNVLKRVVNNQKHTYKKMKSNTLDTFLSNLKVQKIDFIKIDIEGSEQNLLLDLKKNFFESIQLELINYNKIEDNINFIRELSENYNFFEIKSWKLLTVENTINLVENTLRNNPTIDLFLISKEF